MLPSVEGSRYRSKSDKLGLQALRTYYIPRSRSEDRSLWSRDLADDRPQDKYEITVQLPEAGFEQRRNERKLLMDFRSTVGDLFVRVARNVGKTTMDEWWTFSIQYTMLIQGVPVEQDITAKRLWPRLRRPDAKRTSDDPRIIETPLVAFFFTDYEPTLQVTSIEVSPEDYWRQQQGQADMVAAADAFPKPD